MKRLVRYKLIFGSKWLSLSGVMMGVAFFLQALEYFAFDQLSNSDIWNLLLFLVLPMTMEALWCIPLRSETWSRAEAHGIFAAIFSLILLIQVILSCGVFSIVFNSIFLVLGAAAAVLVTWGFIPHRALGMLVSTAVVVQRLLIVTLPRYVEAPDYHTLLQEIPAVCMLLGIVFFFGGLQVHDAEEA